MVQIPRAPVSGANITQQTTAPSISDIGNFTRTSQAIGSAAAALNTQAEEFKQLETLRKVSQGTVNGNRQLADLENEILNDPNLTEVESTRIFNERSQPIIDEIIATISDERAQLQLSVQFQGSQLAKGFNIKRQGRERDISNAELETQALESEAATSIFKADPSMKEMLRGNLITHYTQQIAIGYKTREQIGDRLAIFDETIRKGKVDFDIESLTRAQKGRSEAERILGAKIIQGRLQEDFYGELSLDEEKDKLGEMKNFVERHTQIAKDELETQQKENEQRDAGKILDGEITLEEASRAQIEDAVYSEGYIDDMKEFHRDFRAPKAEGDGDISEFVRLKKLQIGINKKQIFVDADGNEVELTQAQKLEMARSVKQVEDIDPATGLGVGEMKLPEGVFLSERSLTPVESISETVKNTNGKLSLSQATRLVNTSFDDVNKKSDAAYKREIMNLEARMKVIRLRQFNEVMQLNVTETPSEIQAQLDRFLYTFDLRVGAIDNPSEEQIEKIADDVFNKFEVTPQEDGGAGAQGSGSAIKYNAGKTVTRIFGKDDKDIEVDVTLSLPKRK